MNKHNVPISHFELIVYLIISSSFKLNFVLIKMSNIPNPPYIPRKRKFDSNQYITNQQATEVFVSQGYIEDNVIRTRSDNGQSISGGLSIDNLTVLNTTSTADQLVEYANLNDILPNGNKNMGVYGKYNSSGTTRYVALINNPTTNITYLTDILTKPDITTDSKTLSDGAAQFVVGDTSVSSLIIKNLTSANTVLMNNNTGGISSSQITDAYISSIAAISDTKLATISTTGKINDSALPITMNSKTFTGTTSLGISNIIGVCNINSTGSNATTIGNSSSTVNINGLLNITNSNFSSAGIIHNNSSGVFSSSLIINSDITNGTITDTKLATISTAGKISDSALPTSMAAKTFTGTTNLGISNIVGTCNINSTGTNATTIGNSSSVVNISGLLSIINSSFTSAGVIHNNSSGVFSSSLILNADITDGTITDSKLATISSTGKINDSALPSSMAAKTFTGTTTIAALTQIGITNINVSSSSATNIGTGTTTGAVSIGNNNVGASTTIAGTNMVIASSNLSINVSAGASTTNISTGTTSGALNLGSSSNVTSLFGQVHMSGGSKVLSFGAGYTFTGTENYKIIALYDPNIDGASLSNTNYYGFGLENATVRYQTASTGNHVFYANTTELLRITGSTSAMSLSCNTTLASGKTLTLASMTTAGIVHNSSAGLLSSSLIVDADITATTISNGKLATVSSANNVNYIVSRDGSGNFSAGTITSTGLIITPFSTAGLLHNNASGSISSSLIVNADITNGTISDTKLATISTAGKISDSALPSSMDTKTFTGLTSLNGGLTTNGTSNITISDDTSVATLKFGTGNGNKTVFLGSNGIGSLTTINGYGGIILNNSTSLPNNANLSLSGTGTISSPNASITTATITTATITNATITNIVSGITTNSNCYHVTCIASNFTADSFNPTSLAATGYAQGAPISFYNSSRIYGDTFSWSPNSGGNIPIGLWIIDYNPYVGPSFGYSHLEIQYNGSASWVNLLYESYNAGGEGCINIKIPIKVTSNSPIVFRWRSEDVVNNLIGLAGSVNFYKIY